MKTFRIKEYDFYRCKSYVVQRKSVFGFWYNPDNKDAYTTGSYYTLFEAQEAVKRKMWSVKSRIVK